EGEGLCNYQKIGKIGEGTYGVVFKAREKSTNKLVALKKIRLQTSHGVPTTALREVAILKEVCHDNVIKLLDLVQKDTLLYMVFDYLDMDLRVYMNGTKREGLTHGHIRSFMQQLLQGIDYCHSHRILHRDLKPQNLLIDKTGRLIIADLGLSRTFSVPMRPIGLFTDTKVITLWYRAPEILLGEGFYSTAVDMWGVGCVFAEMITLCPLFPGKDQLDKNVINKALWLKICGTPTEKDWPGITSLPDYNPVFPPWCPVDISEHLQTSSKYPLDIGNLGIHLLKSLLIYDPSVRMSARRAKVHPYFFEDTDMLQ
ncbi:kinase-like domain-containing protein, partial [Phycomyces nitens]